MGRAVARGTKDPEVARLAAALMQRMVHQGMTGLTLDLDLTLAPRDGGAMKQARGLMVVELEAE